MASRKMSNVAGDESFVSAHQGGTGEGKFIDS